MNDKTLCWFKVLITKKTSGRRRQQKNRFVVDILKRVQSSNINLLLFFQITKESGGFVELKELKDALDQVGFKLPGYQVRLMIDEFGNKQKLKTPGKLNYNEFEQICIDLKTKEVASSFKQRVTKKENLETLGGMSESSATGTTHSVRLEEQISFSEWINSNLLHDQDLKHLLPIDPEGKALYEKIRDGILLCKLINHSCPDTIDERAINKKNLTVYTKFENLTLALVSSSAIGCNIINIDAHDLQKGKPHLVLGLLWQIIRVGLFSHISLDSCPGLATLIRDDERLEDLMKLSPEAILLRWVNHHLERAGIQRRCNNFTSDISDSEIYSYLLKQIAPAEAGVSMEAIHEPHLVHRAETMLQQAAKMNCRSFVTPQDVVNGVYKLNLAFVANLFNNHPGLDQPEQIEGLESIEETREEKTYRNWMNSMGVKPYVNWLYSDLADGLVIFQLFDIIKPDSVNWQRVHQRFSPLRKFMEKLENCNYAVELGKQQKFSLVGIAGQDISDGNATLTLGKKFEENLLSKSLNFHFSFDLAIDESVHVVGSFAIGEHWKHNDREGNRRVGEQEASKRQQRIEHKKLSRLFNQ